MAIYREVGSRAAVANVLGSLGTTLDVLGEFVRARALREQALAVHRALKSPVEIASTLSNMGSSARHQGLLHDAQAMHEESLSISRSSANTWGIAASLLNLSEMSSWALAKAKMMESLTIFIEIHDQGGAAQVLSGLARSFVAEEPDRAARLWGEAESLRKSIGARRTAFQQSTFDLGGSRAQQ